MKNNRGFSLIELVVVIGLIAILSGVVTINFNSWQKKYAIEGQVKEMLIDLTDARMRAIATKQQHTVFLNPTSYTFQRYSSESDTVGTQIFSKTLKYPMQNFSSCTYSAFSDTPVVIDASGYTSSRMTIAVGIGLSDPAYNCLALSTARVNMGKINGNNCEFK
jgi:prepilin-type N-terminal cleavage/methylation domain-containing protein